MRDDYFVLAERIRAERSQTGRDRAVGDDQRPDAGQVPQAAAPDRAAPQSGAGTAGERLEFYERQDGELGLIEEWDHDENTTYLLRRLRDVAERFRDLFESTAEFEAFFPAISARTDMTAARRQEAVQQLESVWLTVRRSRREHTKSDRAKLARSLLVLRGSGGGIRTPDLWVMSPTSCRCSTPRRVGWRSARRSVLAVWPSPSGPLAACRSRRLGGWGVSAAASPPVGSPPQYSPALRWVTTGFGMGPGGASTLSATGTPHPRMPEAGTLLVRHHRGRG